jgi:hypothetical protein
MFCPSCGTEYTIELKYCNRCGANLGTSLLPPAEPVIINVTKPTLIIGTLMTLITLGGFGAVIAGAIGMARVLHGDDPVMGVVVFGMLAILIVDIFLARLLSKLISAALATTTGPRSASSSMPVGPQQFQPATTTARLQAMPSVTENTTRFFEPYRAPGEATNPPPEKIKR